MSTPIAYTHTSRHRQRSRLIRLANGRIVTNTLAVARLLCPDSSYTLFLWPPPIPESAISVFTTV